MSAQYNVHYDVNQLMTLLEIEEKASEGVTADAITDNLLRSVDQKSKTRGAAQTFYKKLETHSDPDFKNKYEELKVQNVIELDPLVHLLTRINDDQKIKYLLKFQNKAKQRSASSSKKSENSENIELIQRSHSSSTVSVASHLNNANKQTNAESGRISTEVAALNDEEVADSEMKLISRNKNATRKKDTSKKNANKLVNWKFLSLDYQPIDWSKKMPFNPLKSLTVSEQENVLIDDILFILIGIEGKYIRLQPLINKPYKHSICVDNSGDELLFTLTTRITALCPHYSQIIHFIDEIDSGLVNQSLVAAMRAQIKDYFMLVSQLETQHRKGDLTLQKMWYYLQPCFTNLEILKHIASHVMKGNCFGGSVLSILHEKTVSLTGNTKAQEFCLSVTKKASEPYFEILEKWIYEGIIDDPYKEFLVEDKASEDDDNIVSDDLYWENRYSIIRSRIPVFLERHSDMIMKTGKYLSVIRQCGKQITLSYTPEPLIYTTEERIYIETIETAYKFASKELLHLLVDKSDLIGRLKSIKHYFLMDQGDFIVQFMDLAGDELEKPIDDIAPNRLDSLLELSLRTSMMNSDPYKDDVRIELLPDSLHSQMSKILNIGTYLCDENDVESQSYTLQGCEALALKYAVSWPLSLIISRKNITCYQMLFRHLFYCKYVERQLEEVWKGNKIAKQFTLNAVTGYAQAFDLRQKMLNFVQNLEYYIMLEVIEPTFHQFLEFVQTKVASVDDMMKSHEEYIQKCLRDGMLTAGDILQAIVKLLRLCATFSSFMKNSQNQSTQYEMLDASKNIEKAFECKDDNQVNVSLYDSTHFNKSFEDHVANMHKDFNLILHELIQAIKLQTQENYTMLPVLNRLDFNGFYESMDAKLESKE